MRLVEPHKLYVTWHSPRHCCHCATTVISTVFLNKDDDVDDDEPNIFTIHFLQRQRGGMVGKKHFASLSHERQQHAKVMK